MSNKLFGGFVFCCTGIPSRKREEISEKTTSLGGKHYSDLMSDVNYLIVGNRNTDKYNYCIKHRHDIKFLKANAIQEIYDRWLKGEEDIDINQYLLPIFNEISICLSRIEIQKIMKHIGDDSFRKRWYSERFFDFDSVVNLINNNGGKVTESLTMSNTCVITTETEGRRYSKAVEWKIPVLHPIFIYDSFLRKAALKFDDYLLGLNEFHGCDVWKELLDVPVEEKVPQSKEIAQTKVKVKKSSDIWNSIMNDAKTQRHKKIKDSVWDDLLEDESLSKPDNDIMLPDAKEKVSRLFSDLYFVLYGFTNEQAKLITKAIESHNGRIVDQNSTSATHIIVPVSKGLQYILLFKDMPVTLEKSIRKEEVIIVTEWFIERSMYYKKICNDIWGKPINGLNKSKKKFKICISGFTGIELLHIEKLIDYLNFEFCESLSSNRDLLIVNINLFKDILVKNSPILFDYPCKDILDCPIYKSGTSSVSLISTKNKINAAKKWNIPVVSLSYLWEALELSKESNEVIMPSVVNYSWCLFAPSSQQLTESVLELPNNQIIESNLKRSNLSDDELYHSNSAVSLPSPRKAAKKQKYGRLSKPSKQLSLTKKLAEIGKEETLNDCISKPLYIEDDELPTQVGYESLTNHDELIRKLGAKDMNSKSHTRRRSRNSHQ